VSKMEAEVSVMGSLLEHWKQIDADGNGVVSPQEWHGYFAQMKETNGEALYRKAAATMVYEMDIDIGDIYDERIERIRDLVKKKAIMSLSTKEIVEVVWGVLDSSGDGQLTKLEVQFSPLGEVLMSHWSELDSEPDGRVTRKELEAYLLKVEKKDPTVYKAWLVDLVYECGVAGSALEVVTQKMATEQVQKKMQIAEYALCEPKYMLSRMWKTLDVNGDGDVTKREIEESTFGELLSGYWGQLDTEPDGRVKLEEWNAFWETKKEELGEGSTRNLLAELMWEADVPVKDVVQKQMETTSDLRKKHEIAQVELSKLVECIFNVIDSDASGALTKKEVQMSVVGEAMMPHWAQLDSNPDGKVSLNEFVAYAEGVKASQTPDAYMRWLVLMVWDSGINVDDLIDEEAKAKAKALADAETKKQENEAKARDAAKVKAAAASTAKLAAAQAAVGPLAANTVQAGFLRIQEGRFFPTWNPGYFVLTPESLSLYPVRGEEVASTATGVIPMSEMLACCSDDSSASPNTFRLSVLFEGHPVVWPLRASDDGEERKWKMAFLQVQMGQMAQGEAAATRPATAASPAGATTASPRGTRAVHT